MGAKQNGVNGKLCSLKKKKRGLCNRREHAEGRYIVSEGVQIKQSCELERGTYLLTYSLHGVESFLRS